MSNSLAVTDLYTVTVTVNQNEVPLTFYSNDYVAVGKLEPTSCFISVYGMLCKHCSFIETEALAHQFIDAIKTKMLTRIPSITFAVRKVNAIDLEYRTKNALNEARKNTVKIMKLIESQKAKQALSEKSQSHGE